MSELAYLVAKIGAWSVPALVAVVGVVAITGGSSWAGASLICSGFVGLAWDFLFLPAHRMPGRPLALVPEVVIHEDAPLGYFLYHLLPVLAGVLLLAGLLLLALRPST